MSKVQETLREMAKDLHDVGAIDKITLRKFDVKSLSPVPNYTAHQISLIRRQQPLP